MAVASLVPGQHSIVTPSTLFVPGGRFLMGSDEGRLDERPAHGAEVRPRRMGRTPVTNMEYAWFLAARQGARAPVVAGPLVLGPGAARGGLHLVRGHVLLPLAARDARRPVAPAHGGGVGARGPRRDRRAPTPWGREVPRGEIPEPPISGPWPVGRGTANGHGLLDVGTVVREWCYDWYAPDAYRTTRRYDPRGPEEGEKRASRGGSWRRHVRDVAPSARGALLPETRAADVGFRVVREVP